ncbi:hypothetical protein VNO77_03388 [Canavalia gladiata]|uniref:Uncharacterized protein n=1 Tax=Canavalia gladiata TaxID=3824 RepID=A0AAN9R6S8_CANGL
MATATELSSLIEIYMVLLIVKGISMNNMVLSTYVHCMGKSSPETLKGTRDTPTSAYPFRMGVHCPYLENLILRGWKGHLVIYEGDITWTSSHVDAIGKVWSYCLQEVHSPTPEGLRCELFPSPIYLRRSPLRILSGESFLSQSLLLQDLLPFSLTGLSGSQFSNLCF